MAEDKELTLRQHLEELRKRSIYSTIAIAITTGVSFSLAAHIFSILEALAPEDTNFIFTEAMELLVTYFKLSIYCGVALALPFLIYQALMFIRPALTSRERMWVYILLPAVALFFAGGVAFGYFFVPRMLSFLIEFPLAADVANPEIKISGYVSLVARLLFGLGLVFETPLVIFFLARIGLVTPQWLLRQWRYAIVVCYIVAAIITPTPDPINCSIVALALVALYFLSIILAWIAWKLRGENQPAHASS